MNRMKKISALFLVFCLVAVLLPANVFAASNQLTGNIKFNTTETADDDYFDLKIEWTTTDPVISSTSDKNIKTACVVINFPNSFGFTLLSSSSNWNSVETGGNYINGYFTPSLLETDNASGYFIVRTKNLPSYLKLERGDIGDARKFGGTIVCTPNGNSLPSYSESISIADADSIGTAYKSLNFNHTLKSANAKGDGEYILPTTDTAIYEYFSVTGLTDCGIDAGGSDLNCSSGTYINGYVTEAYVTDSSGRNITGVSAVRWSSSLAIKVEPTVYYYLADTQETFTVYLNFIAKMVDFNGKTYGAEVAVSTPVVFSRQSYPVTLNYNNGTEAETLRVYHNAKVTDASEPVRDGYSFDGWYTDENCTTGNEFNLSTQITSPLSLYAKWSLIGLPEAKWGVSSDNLSNIGTLAEALAAKPAYIQLNTDATLKSAVKIESGETLTFDLNGKSLFAESGIDSFSNSGTLNIIGGKTEQGGIVGSGNIINNNSENCGIYNKGTLTMKNVSVKGSNPMNNNSGTAVIENCTFLNEGESFYDCAILNNTDCYLELSDCTLKGNAIGLDNKGIVRIKKTADISGEKTCDIQVLTGTLDISGVTGNLEEWNMRLIYGVDIKLPLGYSLYDSDGLMVENLDELEYGFYTIRVADTSILSYDINTKSATVVVEEAGKYSLIFVDYGEGNRLQNVDIVEFDFKAGVNTVPQDITTFTLGKDDKIMLWQNMTILTPLCETFIIK